MALRFLNNGYFAGNVGIGTDNPDYKLEVQGEAGIELYNGTGGGNVLNFRPSLGDANKYNMSISSYDHSGSGVGPADGLSINGYDGVSFATGSSTGREERMRINASGNVGIGDTLPAVKLQVSTNSPTNNVATLIGDGWVGSDAYHKQGGLLLISGTSQNSTQTGAGIAFQTRTTADNNYWKSSIIMDRDGAIRFTLGGAGTSVGSEDFTILSGGNVGIGTDSPGYKLDVSSASAVGIRVLTTGFTNLDLVSPRTAGNLGGLRFKQDIDTYQTSEFLGLHGGGFDWKSGDGSASPSIKMSMLPNGNVGIGTTGPIYKLDVSGGVRSTHFRDGLQGNGTTSTTVGWYKVASWTGGSKRGGSEIKLSTTGGSFTPITWIIRCFKNWSYDATLKLEQYGYANVWFTKARIVRDTTTDIVYVEIYQPGTTAITVQMYQTSLMGYDSNVTMVTGTLAAGTTTANESVRAELPFIAGGTSVEALTIGTSGNTGPYLPLAGGTMTGTGEIRTPDNFKLKVGTAGDMEIYHNATNTLIDNQTGNLLIQTTSGSVQINKGTAENMAEFITDGAVKLYYDSARKFETTNTGVTITGGWVTNGVSVATANVEHTDNTKSLFGNGNDLAIYHDGSNSYIVDTGTGTFNLRGSTQVIIGGTNGEVGIQYVENAGVGLRHNNVTKLTTESTGVAVVGNITVDSALLSNQENTDVSGLELVAQVAIATYTAAFFDFVVKKGTNVRSGTVYACHDGTNVQFTETSTQDIGDTSDVVLSVDISGGQMRLLANAATAAWSVKSLIRAI